MAVAGAALITAVAAQAQVTWSIGNDEPAYYEPAPAYRAPPPTYYEPAPPAYYPPPPTYYQPPPAYYQPPPPTYYRPAPPPYYGAPAYEEPGWQGYRGAEQPRLSQMQQRAYDNCNLLAWRDRPRCRATVMSTVR